MSTHANITFSTDRDISWPPHAAYEKVYLGPFLKHPQTMITNAETTCGILIADEMVLPYTVNNTEYDASCMCSAYTAIIGYPLQMLATGTQTVRKRLLYRIVLLCGVLLKKIKINKIVALNNWLLSVNPYPQWTGENLREITHRCVKKYPQHMVTFRSLTQQSHGTLMSNLAKAGYLLIPIRPVYIYASSASRNLDRDYNRLINSSYTIVHHTDITSADYDDIVTLYHQLYIDKHSHYNPAITRCFVEHLHINNLAFFQGFRDEKQNLIGVIATATHHNIMVPVLAGYDTGMPQKAALYPMLMSLALKHAQHKNITLNLGSGASRFKLSRGAREHIEYSALYIHHLAWYKRVVWRTFAFLLNHIGIHFMGNKNA